MSSEFEQQLIKAGYKKFEDRLYSALYAYSKHVRDHLGKKYFINIYKYNTYQQLGVGEDIDSWSVKLQFNLSMCTMNVTLFSFKNKSIEKIEQFVEDLWCKVKADYYDKY